MFRPEHYPKPKTGKFYKRKTHSICFLHSSLLSLHSIKEHNETIKQTYQENYFSKCSNMHFPTYNDFDSGMLYLRRTRQS